MKFHIFLYYEIAETHEMQAVKLRYVNLTVRSYRMLFFAKVEHF